MKLDDKLCVLQDPRAAAVLKRLHSDARCQNFSLAFQFARYWPQMALRQPLAWSKLEGALDNRYLSLDPDNGFLCYQLARALRAQRIVEFGTSMGVSTIYLASAVRANGGGTVIATELVPEKAQRARANLQEAGLEAYVDLRVGDALETLKGTIGPVDMLINDGFPRFALPIMKLLAPTMRPGAIALCGNAALFPGDHVNFLRWVRDPANGFSSCPLPMKLAGEMSVKNKSPQTEVPE